jgi:hypothetical protein
MPDLEFIAKKARLAPSQDWAFLRSEGLAHVERLGHEKWTDYNVHDPGVTLLELLCYGIAELGYRTGYGIRDLLTEIDRGVAVNHADFHTARRVLTGGPVTFDDLRKLLIDVHGVRNAWIEPHSGIRYGLDARAKVLTDADAPGLPRTDAAPAPNEPLSGLYDVFVEYDEFVAEEPRVAVLGPPDVAAGEGGYVQVGNRGLRFDAGWEFELLSVDVYPETAGEVRVRLVDAAGAVLAETSAVAELPDEANRVDLGFRVPPGAGYRLEAAGTAARLYRTLDPVFPYVHEGVARIVSGSAGEQTIATYNFFYAWRITYAVPPQPRGLPAAGLPPVDTVTREDVRLAVADRLHAHRNLCEDFVNVCELAVEEVALCTDLELSPDADVEAVLAEIFDRVGEHVSPEVPFHTLEEMLERGREPDEVFAGPTLDHGFIDDEELRALRRRCELRASDVIEILMDVDGVKAVRSLWLLSFLDGDDEPRAQEEWMLTLATDRFRAPVFDRRRSKVIFYKNGLPYYADRAEVEALLAARRAERTSSKLADGSTDLPVPAGVFRDPEVYDPLQNELPRAYGVGQVRIPASQPALRKAQAKQLKAYLLLFEQLLANHLSQLAHVRQLFSWRDEAETTYFTQPVTGVAGLEEIYDQELLDAEHGGSLAAALAAIVEDADVAAERRGRFLDHLLARFAEDLSEYGRLTATLDEDARTRVIADQRRLLADYPRVGSERGQGYDLRRPDEADNLTGYAYRVYRLLGIGDATWRQLAGHRFELEEVAGEGGETLWRFVLRGEGAEVLFASTGCESAAAVEVLLDFVVEFGSDRDRYRLSADESAWELVHECPGEEPRVLGATTTAGGLDEVVSYFQDHGDGAEGFHVIEHVLLRKRTGEDPFMPVQLDDPGQCQCVEVRDPYSFRATVLLPSWPRRFRDLRFRRLVEDTLRVEAPAHVYLKVCWISHLGMKRFEIAWDEWRRRLAALAQAPPGCRGPELPVAAAPLTGELPLPETGPEHAAYRDALAALIDELHSQVSVHPLARLHDCEETTGDAPQITLNHTNLGTF